MRRKKRKFAGNQFVGSLKKVQTEVIKVDQENDEEEDGPINKNTQQETPKGIPRGSASKRKLTEEFSDSEDFYPLKIYPVMIILDLDWLIFLFLVMF